MSAISRNIAYNLSGQGLLVILSFVSVKFIYVKLGADILGIIFFTFALNTMVSAVLEMGLCATTVREISQHKDSQPQYIEDFIKSGNTFYLGVFALYCVAIYLVSPIIVDKWISLSSLDRDTAIWAFRVLGIANMCAMPRAFYTSIFRGLQRMEFNNVIDVSTTAVQQAGTILILNYSGGLSETIYWMASIYFVRLFIYVYFLLRFFPARVFAPGFKPYVVKRNLSFFSKMMFITISSSINSQMDKLVLSKLMPIGSVGYYGFIYGLVAKGQLISGAVSHSAYPALSALHAKGEREEMLRQYHKLQDVLCMGSIPFFSLLTFAAVPVFSYVFTPEAARELLATTLLMCLGIFLLNSTSLPYIFAVATGAPGFAARQNVIDLIAAAPIAIVLIHWFGMTGAALSVVVMSLLKYLYFIPVTCRRSMGIPVSAWYLHIVKILALVALSYGVALLLATRISGYSPMPLIAAYLAATAVFIAGGYAAAHESTRQSARQHLSSLMDRLSSR